MWQQKYRWEYANLVMGLLLLQSESHPNQFTTSILWQSALECARVCTFSVNAWFSSNILLHYSIELSSRYECAPVSYFKYCNPLFLFCSYSLECSIAILSSKWNKVAKDKLTFKIGKQEEYDVIPAPISSLLRSWLILWAYNGRPTLRRPLSVFNTTKSQPKFNLYSY